MKFIDEQLNLTDSIAAVALIESMGLSFKLKLLTGLKLDRCRLRRTRYFQLFKCFNVLENYKCSLPHFLLSIEELFLVIEAFGQKQRMSFRIRAELQVMPGYHTTFTNRESRFIISECFS